MRVVILAERPGSLEPVCGVPLVERLLRGLQRAGCREALVLTSEPEPFRAFLARPSWARADIHALVQARQSGSRGPVTLGELAAAGETGLTVVLPGEVLLDGRLLEELLAGTLPEALVDSAPPEAQRALLDGVYRDAGGRGAVIGAAVVSISTLGPPEASWDAALHAAIETGLLPVLDVAVLDPHVRGLRRDLRPLWFPAPGSARARRLATEVVLQSAQKAILDIPAYVHAPIENALIRWLCRTPITPNQLTLATNVLAFGVTALFALGRIGAGTVGALVVGVLDGLDGKQARVKVETSAVGEWEHVADYVYEFSWWAALAWHFAGTGEVRSALFLFGLMWGADLAERIARYLVKHGTGREVETLSRVDVWFRLVGGRRNIFVWIFAAAVVLGRPAEGFVVFTAWGILSSLFQVVRAPMALLGRRAPIT